MHRASQRSTNGRLGRLVRFVLFGVAATLALTACARSNGSPTVRSDADSGSVVAVDTARAGVADRSLPDTSSTEYEGTNDRGVPNYARGYPFASEDSQLLRRAYGIEDPRRLYLSDSSDDAILKYDTSWKRCRRCLVDSYRVGFVSVRRAGESWEDAERRVRRAPAREFTGRRHPQSTSLADLDPEARPEFERILAAGRSIGFRLHVTATYRSPLREAFLMSEGGGRTHTLTSSHSYGRAVDVVIDDGNRAHARTRADWVAFRRWVAGYPTTSGERFHILGQADATWDWPHVELPTQRVGFRSIEDAIVRARRCLAPGSTEPCDFPSPSHL